MAPSTHKAQPRLYFAYGSNLSLAQMASRCPTSTYHSFGLLKNYRWIISERGYANVIKSSPPGPSPVAQEKPSAEHVVYGMLYTLEPSDERALDLAEGVPHAYTKHVLDVEVISRSSASLDGEREASSGMGSGKERELVKALVYVDETRLEEGICKEEYVGRMNRGIRDAVGKGMETKYVEGVIRRFVMAAEVDEEKIGDPFHPSVLVAGEYE
jgi:gamma-glutamylcyclotransferase